MNKYNVEAFWDSVAKVWVATSKDVVGLVTEAENIDTLINKIKKMIPELLILNQVISEEKSIEIEWQLIINNQELIKIAS